MKADLVSVENTGRIAVVRFDRGVVRWGRYGAGGVVRFAPHGA